MKTLRIFSFFAWLSLLLLTACGETEKEIQVTFLAISPNKAEIVIGETLSLRVTVSPSNATYDGITWRSTQPAIASVSESGQVTAVSEGNATITAMAGGKTASCSVTVTSGTVAVSSIQLDKTTLELEEGESATLVATISPDDATDKTITWTSSKEEVATVKDGVVSAVSEGEATITASAGEKSSSCKVTVTKKVIAVESITLNNTELCLDLGDHETLIATVSPEDASDKSVTWSSDNPTVASVDNGTVKAHNAGTATITAKAGDKTASCSVTVIDPIALEIERERKALIAFYNALDGDHWENNTNWCSDRPVSDWFGIHTTYNGLVSEILLTSNGLNGTITSDMLAFRELRELYLENNPLRLELTDEKPLWFNSLWRFDLKYCKPYTSLPEWFYELPSITMVQMSIDRIPPQIRQMTSLNHLELCTLPVPIPDEIGLLTKLKKLYIYNDPNEFEGFNMPSASNEEGGPIPENLGNLRELEELIIMGMNCTGRIPSSFGNLSRLVGLVLSWNQLSGEIPSELGHLTSLSQLTLSYNRLTGPLPESICNLTNLYIFDISNNDLSGELPADMGRMLKKIDAYWETAFNIVGNHFSGRIPDSILSHPKWTYLWYPFVTSNNFDLQGVTIPGPDIKGKDIFGNPVDSDQIYKNNKLTILYQYSTSYGNSPGYFPCLSYVKSLYDAYKDKSVSIVAWGHESESVEEDIAFVHQYGLEDWIFLNAYKRYVNGLSMYPWRIVPDLILIDDSGNVILDSTRLKVEFSYDEITAFIENYFASF